MSENPSISNLKIQLARFHPAAAFRRAILEQTPALCAWHGDHHIANVKSVVARQMRLPAAFAPVRKRRGW
jgi:hypothetical protein